MLERHDIDFPLWRKKVDSSLLNRGETPIPKWLHGIWNVEAIFSDVSSKKATGSKVTSFFNGKRFDVFVTHKKSEGKFWLRLENDLVSELQQTFLSTYMRSLEAELVRSDDKNSYSHRDIEAKIPFWEFLDIEFDSINVVFRFTAHYTQQPQFPKLFSELVNSAAVSRLKGKLSGNDVRKFPFQNWKERSAYKREIGAVNVIYFLMDSNTETIYVGEAQDLIRRFNQGH